MTSTLTNHFERNAYLKFGAVLFALAASSIWIFSRVRDINPAILQDEWVYLITSRNFSPWEQNLPFDFGNYLFNLVYSSTLLCGESFYSCAKILNILFLQGFALTLFVIALRFMPFWGALVFYIATSLSPTMIYSSMYLPESMLFFFLGWTLFFVLRAADDPSWRNWALVGIPLGLAALSKPHALMAAVAIGLFLLVGSLERRPYWQEAIRNAGSLLAMFLIVRVGVGFLVAGPKSLNVFGAYGATSSIGEFVGGVGAEAPTSSDSSLVGAGTVTGAVGLFPDQLFIHVSVVLALTGAAIAALLIALLSLIPNRSVRPVHRISTLVLIWLGTLIVMIVLFTGWITGAGDDHTTRVLLRYYDYLYPIILLAGLSVFFDKLILTEVRSWLRWIAIVPVLLIISGAYIGLFGGLQIQIADAPNLAGLVVDRFTIDATANLMFATLLLMAFAPKFSVWAAALLIPFVMISTGYQIQDQYRGFRLDSSPADEAGSIIREFVPSSELDNVLVLAETRFDGRVASFWMGANNDLELLVAGSVFPLELVKESTEFVLILGNLEVESGEVISSSEGYKIVKLKR